MKIARYVLKIAALSLGVAAAACCVVAYWDRLASFFSGVREKVVEKGACCCHPSEYDDYADWDE